MERNLKILLISSEHNSYSNLYSELEQEEDFSIEVVNNEEEAASRMKKVLSNVILCTDDIGEKECVHIYERLQTCSKKHFVDFILLYDVNNNWGKHPEELFPVEDVFPTDVNLSGFIKLLKSKHSLRQKMHSHYKDSFQRLFNDVFSKGGAGDTYEECNRGASSVKKNSDANDFNLTPREIQILDLSARGLTIKEIGDRLFISNRTVEKYITQILKKIKSVNITESVAKAIKNGIIMV